MYSCHSVFTDWFNFRSTSLDSQQKLQTGKWFWLSDDNSFFLFFFFLNSYVHSYGRFLSPDYGFQLAQGFSPTIPGFLCFVYVLLLSCLPKLQRQETVKLYLIKIWHAIRYLGVSPHVGRLQRTATESILLSLKGTFSWSARSSAFGRSLESSSIL